MGARRRIVREMKRWVCAAGLVATLSAAAGCAGGHAASGTLAATRVPTHSGGETFAGLDLDFISVCPH
jgi:hypothetical protein